MTGEKTPPVISSLTTPSPCSRLAEKIEWLIDHMWPPDIELVTSDAEIAKVVALRTGEEISRSTIWKLRTGRQPNPTLRTLNAIATFFKVPIGYFGDDGTAEAVEDQLILLAMLRDGGIDRATLRTLVDLSPNGRKMIGEVIASAARMEHQNSVGRDRAK
ncbi:helix-turn-helix domain-containing protein [Spirillospora sp. NBC_00431]